MNTLAKAIYAPSAGTATFLIFLSGIMWSFSGVIVASLDWNPWAVAGARSAIGLVMTFPFLAYYISLSQGTTFLSAAIALPKRLFSIRNDELNRWKWLGVACYAINNISLTIAFQMGVVADAVFLHFSGFLIVALLSRRVLGERLSFRDGLAVVFAFVGILALTIDGVRLNTVAGTILGWVACLTMAGTQLCLGKVREKTKTGFEVFEYQILSDFLTAIVGVPAMIMSAAPQPSPIAWILIVILGVVPWGLPDVFYMIGVKEVKGEDNVPIFRALIMAGLDPVLTAVWPILFIHQVPTSWAITGAVLVVISMAYQEYLRRKRAEPATA